MRSLKTGAALLAATMAAFVVAHNVPTRAPYADFRIHVTTTDKGVELQCEKGCMWETLTYSCGKLPCAVWISENGTDSEGTALEYFGLTPEDTPRGTEN